MTMPRRKFIEVLTASGASVVLPSVLPGCDGDVPCLPTAAPSMDAFDGWAPGEPSDDIRLTTLSYALLAPNPHNLQPWSVQLRADREYDVFIDRGRTLPETDPLFRQLHVGVGCFVELAALSARSFGHTARVEYFPEGEYENDVLEDRPVARVRLSPDRAVQPDPLFPAIAERCSNEEVFDGQPLDAAVADALQAEVVQPGVALQLGESAEFVEEMAQFVIDAITIELGHPQRDKETIGTFRFTDEELLEHRDGTDARSLGAVGITAEQLLAPGSLFKDVGVRNHEARARSASAFGIVVTQGNCRVAQLDAGRAYVRMNLRATAMGVAMSPFSQVLQEYPDMLALQAEFLDALQLGPSQTAQMLFRLGHAEPSAASPRRRAHDFTPC